MKITFLGTAAGKPSKYRNVTSIALELENNDYILIDCGEATQHQIIKSKLKFTKLHSIYITHLHGDHIFGLPGLLASLNEYRTDELNIFGPVGLLQYINFIKSGPYCNISNYEINVIEIPDIYNTINYINYKSNTYKVECCYVEHCVQCYSYVITKSNTQPKIDIDKLQPILDKYANEIINLGFSPINKIISTLKENNIIQLSDYLLDINNFSRREKDIKIIICLDNSNAGNIIKYIGTCDVLVHECTYAFTEDTKNDDISLTQKATEHGHSTSRMASRVANKLNCTTLIFTHFSNRYELIAGKMDIEDFLIEDSKKISNCDVLCAYDFGEFFI
jgi:ribonuclease Z